MRKMKDSGVEWIGKIPEDWEVEKLKYIGASKNETAIYKKGERFIGLEHVDSFNGNIIGQDVDYDECETPIFEKGDFLFSKLRPYLAKGFLAEQRGFCTSELIRIKFNEEQYNKYYKYLLLSHKFIDFVNSMTYGVKMPRTSWQELREQILTVPPIQEQEIIANHLDEKCGSINDDIAIIDNQLSVLEAYKKSVITEAVTKGLDKNAEMKDSGVEWIGEIPKHWNVVRGKYVLNLLSKPIRETDEVITCFRDGEVTLRSNRREDGFTMADKEFGYQGIDIGDLVVHGMDGFAGAIGISDSRGKGSPVLSVLDSHFSKKFIMYYLRSVAYSDVFSALATGIRVRSVDLRWNKLANLPYPIPPLKEQEEISQYIESRIAKSDEVIAIKQNQLSLLDEYKKSLIYEYVTGKREV